MQVTFNSSRRSVCGCFLSPRCSRCFGELGAHSRAFRSPLPARSRILSFRRAARASAGRVLCFCVLSFQESCNYRGPRRASAWNCSRLSARTRRQADSRRSCPWPAAPLGSGRGLWPHSVAGSGTVQAVRRRLPGGRYIDTGRR